MSPGVAPLMESVKFGQMTASFDSVEMSSWFQCCSPVVTKKLLLFFVNLPDELFLFYFLEEPSRGTEPQL